MVITSTNTFTPIIHYTPAQVFHPRFNKAEVYLVHLVHQEYFHPFKIVGIFELVDIFKLVAISEKVNAFEIIQISKIVEKSDVFLLSEKGTKIIHESQIVNISSQSPKLQPSLSISSAFTACMVYLMQKSIFLRYLRHHRDS